MKTPKQSKADILRSFREQRTELPTMKKCKPVAFIVERKVKARIKNKVK